MERPGTACAESRPRGGQSRRAAERRAISLAQAEQNHILEVMAACGGHGSQAAALLGIGSATLQRRLREYRDAGIAVPAFDPQSAGMR